MGLIVVTIKLFLLVLQQPILIGPSMLVFSFLQQSSVGVSLVL